MSDRDQVLAVFPSAYVYWCWSLGYHLCYAPKANALGTLLGLGDTEAAAWLDSSNRLTITDIAPGQPPKSKCKMPSYEIERAW
jgi:hypothetical protein